MVAVQETESNSNGKKVKNSMMRGPNNEPIVPLILNKKNCITGMYAAMSGNSCCGLRGSCLRMKRFDDHPMKHAVMTAFECHIDDGMDP